jgi:hypothetical protein
MCASAVAALPLHERYRWSDAAGEVLVCHGHQRAPVWTRCFAGSQTALRISGTDDIWNTWSWQHAFGAYRVPSPLADRDRATPNTTSRRYAYLVNRAANEVYRMYMHIASA